MEPYENLALLRAQVMTFEDAQKFRISISNRAGALERGVAALDKDSTAAITDHLRAIEDISRKDVAKAYRHVVSPAVRTWQKRTKGVGEHLLALLLAEIGDPCIAHPLDKDGNYTAEPYWRTLYDLWAYCGLALDGKGAIRKRKKGMSEKAARATGRPNAKRHLYLLAEAQLKSSGPYRALYDTEKAKALAKGWTPGHAHAHGLRLVSKRLLRDLHRARATEFEV